MYVFRKNKTEVIDLLSTGAGIELQGSSIGHIVHEVSDSAIGRHAFVLLSGWNRFHNPDRS